MEPAAKLTGQAPARNLRVRQGWRWTHPGMFMFQMNMVTPFEKLPKAAVFRSPLWRGSRIPVDMLTARERPRSFIILMAWRWIAWVMFSSRTRTITSFAKLLRRGWFQPSLPVIIRTRSRLIPAIMFMWRMTITILLNIHLPEWKLTWRDRE